MLVSSLLQEKSSGIRQALAAAIPSQERLQEAVNKNKASWAALRAKILGPNSPPERTSLEAFVSHALRQGAPTQIAHVIQLVAKTVDEATFKKMLLLVDRLIILNDNYMATMEGLECALFQGMLYSEIGLFRRSWLIYRRALNAAQLLGLHRTRVGIWQDVLWWALYQADRFSSFADRGALRRGGHSLQHDLRRKGSPFEHYDACVHCETGHHVWKNYRSESPHAMFVFVSS
jgi:hypothetical protein